MSPLQLYNSYTRALETFVPLSPGHAGIYICGPTVYGPPHLGHVRGPIVFDVLRRLLVNRGFAVRFVRNITDVGHLVGDVDEGEDKLQKQARLEQIEPMAIAQTYTELYNGVLRQINVLHPDIEPRASGHIIEQIELIEKIMAAGLAYEVNGNVYFNVPEYARKHKYGKLSGRVLEDLIAGAGGASRKLEGQEEKNNPADFALWKKAAPEHIMQWSSPWGKGFPGWHIECSAMSAKYLGEHFDIHGGGMDLLFPHHEAEIAQSTAACGQNPAKYWIHHNMVTINGQKMAKSLNNGIQVFELFNGDHPLLEQAYSPMTLRFFILQAHYRGTLDFGNEALKASEKGLQKLFNAKNIALTLKASDHNNYEVADIENNILSALNDDLNTPQAIAHLFEAVRVANSTKDNNIQLNQENIDRLNQIFEVYLIQILGLKEEKTSNNQSLDQVMTMLLDLRNKAKIEKHFALSDEIRDKLSALGFEIQDGRDGSTWR